MGAVPVRWCQGLRLSSAYTRKTPSCRLRPNRKRDGGTSRSNPIDFPVRTCDRGKRLPLEPVWALARGARIPHEPRMGLLSARGPRQPWRCIIGKRRELNQIRVGGCAREKRQTSGALRKIRPKQQRQIGNLIERLASELDREA